MAYSDVEWTSGDTMTEANLDQMVANADQVRADMLKQNIASAGFSHGVEDFRNPPVAAGSEYRITLKPLNKLLTPVSAPMELSGTWESVLETGIQFGTGFTDRIVSQRLVIDVNPGGAGWENHGDLGRFYFVRSEDHDELNVSISLRGNFSRSFESTSDPGWSTIEAKNFEVWWTRNAGAAGWATVSWSGGNLVSDTKLNQMADNQDRLRSTYLSQSILNVPLFSSFIMPDEPAGQINQDIALRMRIGGVPSVAKTTPFRGTDGWSNLFLPNEDISTLPNGLTQVELVAENDSFPGYDLSVLSKGVFWKTTAHRYASFAGRFRHTFGRGADMSTGIHPLSLQVPRSVDCLGFTIHASEVALL